MVRKADKDVDIITLLTRIAEGGTVPSAVIEAAISTIRKLRRDFSMCAAQSRITRISISSSGRFAVASECFNPASSLGKKTQWLADHDLFVADGRAFALVDSLQEVYFMDCITGSLYQFGECLTSPSGRTGFARNKVKAMEILLAARAAEGSEDELA